MYPADDVSVRDTSTQPACCRSAVELCVMKMTVLCASTSCLPIGRQFTVLRSDCGPWGTTVRELREKRKM